MIDKNRAGNIMKITTPGIVRSQQVDFCVMAIEDSVMKNWYSVDSVFGGKLFYDENGNELGYSVDSVLGGELYYDKNSNPMGNSVDSVFGGKLFYDKNNESAGFSVDSVLGGSLIYDKDAHCVGGTVDGVLVEMWVSLMMITVYEL